MFQTQSFEGKGNFIYFGSCIILLTESFSNSDKSISPIKEGKGPQQQIPEYFEEEKITFLSAKIVIVSNKSMLGDLLAKQLGLDLGRSIANFENFVLEQEFVLKSNIVSKSATIIKQIDRIHEKYATEHRLPVIVNNEVKHNKFVNLESDLQERGNGHMSKPRASPPPKSKVLIIEESVEQLASDDEIEFGVFQGSPNKRETLKEINKVHKEETKALKGHIKEQGEHEDESWKKL
jgi:hypothetical protein